MDRLSQIHITPLKKIINPKGNIYHGLKKSESDFVSFGEAYFSTILFNEVKGWKKHTKMHLNLIVPCGVIKFVVYSEEEKEFREFIIGEQNYIRLHIPPGFWMAFQGIGKELNMLLNIASIPHDPEEAENRSLDELYYSW